METGDYFPDSDPDPAVNQDASGHGGHDWD